MRLADLAPGGVALARTRQVEPRVHKADDEADHARDLSVEWKPWRTGSSEQGQTCIGDGLCSVSAEWEPVCHMEDRKFRQSKVTLI